jgi:transposase-like protein
MKTSFFFPMKGQPMGRTQPWNRSQRFEALEGTDRKGRLQAFPGKGLMTPEKEELHRLHKEVKRLEMERDILKKAAAFFANLSK